MATEAQKRAAKKYDDTNTVMVSVKLNKKTDADIINAVKSEPSMQGYIKALVRNDIYIREKIKKNHAKEENE